MPPALPPLLPQPPSPALPFAFCHLMSLIRNCLVNRISHGNLWSPPIHFVMLFILFCDFLLVLDGPGPPREINSSSSFDSASRAGAGAALRASAGPGSLRRAVPPTPGGFLRLGFFQCNRGAFQGTWANKRKCPRTLVLFAACARPKLRWLRGGLKPGEAGSALLHAALRPVPGLPSSGFTSRKTACETGPLVKNYSRCSSSHQPCRTARVRGS